MAIQSASAKLYTGIRCWCVDKNISANLVSFFHLGNNVVGRNFFNGVETFGVPGAKVQKIRRAIADLTMTPSVTLNDSRLKTFGGGNNVITQGTPRVINNTNNWKVNASVVCKFPTYFRIDVEKLQLPEGTTCTVSLEEGWIKDGEYLESTKAPSSSIGNFFTFRTPWYGLSFMRLQANVNYAMQRIRPFANTAISTSSQLSASGVRNPGKLASLLVDLFRTTALIGKRTGIVFPQSPYLMVASLNATIGKFLTTSATTNEIVSSISTLYTRLRFFASSQASSFVSSVDAEKYKGIVDEVFPAISAFVSAPIKTVRLTKNIVATASINSQPLKIKQLGASIVSQSSVSLSQIDSPMIINYTAAITGLTYGVVLSGTVNCKIHWWNGTVTTATAPGTYNSPSTPSGSHQISISGTLTGFNGFTSSGNARVSRIQSFGTLGLTDISNSCQLSNDITQLPVKFPSTITNISRMFQSGNISTQAPELATWNTVNVTNMERVFFNCASFNTNIGSWNTSNVTTMARMFGNATAFNQNITSWNTANVTDMNYMFNYATSFNQNINSWNVAKVTNMSYMFGNATAFNQILNSWNTASVSNITYMFNNAILYNGGNMEGWNISGVTSLKGTFAGATAFNGLVGSWNTTNVTDMSETFQNCINFNQNLGYWQTGNVTTTANMFDGASSFNQALPSNWIKTRYMNQMFLNASAFNQDIGDWQLYKSGKGAFPYSIDMLQMLNGCGMNTANYSKTLIKWCNYQHFNNGGQDEPVFCRLGSGGRTYHNTTYSGNYPYTNAVAARAYLIQNTPNVQPGGGKKWTITGDALV